MPESCHLSGVKSFRLQRNPKLAVRAEPEHDSFEVTSRRLFTAHLVP